MQVSRAQGKLPEISFDALVVGLTAEQPLSGGAADIDRLTGGLISRLLEQKEITGAKYELTPVLSPAGLAARQLLIVGLGPASERSPGNLFRAASAAARHLAAKPRRSVGFCFPDDLPSDVQSAAIAGSIVGCQGQDLYRAEKKRHSFNEVAWWPAGDESLATGQILGESINLTRRLINEPPAEIYPESFAQRATNVAREAGLTIEVWDRDRLEAERCGSLLAVAKGSNQPPRLVIIRHDGGPSGAAPLALVGKGVTFDSGGLSLKPTDGMLTMKCDMSGAATVLGAMQAIARLKLPLNVIGLMGLVENMPGPDAMKLGDVLTARTGRTIEVHNTDAEGRLVLADVLSVAVDMGAAKIIDLATLTGACVVALGNDVAGLMTNHQAWCDVVAAAARQCGEPAWQLPMFKEYDDLIKSEVADIKNVGEGRWGGAITAAKFLEQFVGVTPWTHMDIAGPAFLEKPKPWLDAGASGIFVRTLVEVARGWKG